MRQTLVAVLFVVCGVGSGADAVVIPLVDPADPVRITNARLEFEDDIRPVMSVELENKTDQVISTSHVWLNSVRFYTKTEVARAGDSKIWDCGLSGAAAMDEKAQPMHPGARVTVRIARGQCDHDRNHEHFSIEVSRLGSRFSEPAWQRSKGDSSKLLIAAMPHP